VVPVKTGAHSEPIRAYREAIARLPNREAPLIDRLFALECLARAGRDARAEREKLAPARRAAEAVIEDEWEADVPHAALLGQALAAIGALDEDPPSSWPPLLEQTLNDLAQRQTKFGIASDPILLASVIRGLATAQTLVPNRLLDAARGYFEQGPSALGAAELAEALAQHRNGEELARYAAEIVFSERHASSRGSAVARWWLADRWRSVTSEDVAAVDVVAAARAQALMTGASDVRTAAMLAEVAGRSVETLIVLPEAELERLRARSRGRSLMENYAWRTLSLVAAGAVILWQLRRLLGWVGIDKPTAKLIDGITVAVVTLATAAIVIASKAGLRRLGRPIPGILEEADWVFPILAGLIALFIRL
jgi:hypothetical protein